MPVDAPPKPPANTDRRRRRRLSHAEHQYPRPPRETWRDARCHRRAARNAGSCRTGTFGSVGARCALRLGVTSRRQSQSPDALRRRRFHSRCRLCGERAAPGVCPLRCREARGVRPERGATGYGARQWASRYHARFRPWRRALSRCPCFRERAAFVDGRRVFSAARKPADFHSDCRCRALRGPRQAQQSETRWHRRAGGLDGAKPECVA